MPRQLQKNQDGGQGMESPVRADEKLAPVMGGFKVR